MDNDYGMRCNLHNLFNCSFQMNKKKHNARTNLSLSIDVFCCCMHFFMKPIIHPFFDATWRNPQKRFTTLKFLRRLPTLNKLSQSQTKCADLLSDYLGK